MSDTEKDLQHCYILCVPEKEVKKGEIDHLKKLLS